MSMHLFNNNSSQIESRSALDFYLNDNDQIAISERLHANAGDSSTSLRARTPELFEELFPPGFSLDGFRESTRPLISCDRRASESDRKPRTAPQQHDLDQDSSSSCSSPPPSLDSREATVQDDSVCTDDMVPPRLHPNTLEIVEGGAHAISMVVPQSLYSDSENEVQLAPTVVSSDDAFLSDGAENSANTLRRGLRCAFWFLGCRKGYHKEEAWLTHCNLHLKNRKDKRPVPCHICNRDFGGWNRWLRHNADHQREGINIKKYRTHSVLVPRLWSLKIIQDREWLELIHRGRLDAGCRNYAHMHNPERERRQLAAHEWRG